MWPTQDSMHKLYVLSQNSWSSRNISILSGGIYLLWAVVILKRFEFSEYSKRRPKCRHIKIRFYVLYHTTNLKNEILREPQPFFSFLAQNSAKIYRLLHSIAYLLHTIDLNCTILSWETECKLFQVYVKDYTYFWGLT